jgi:hypothetical protein
LSTQIHHATGEVVEVADDGIVSASSPVELEERYLTAVNAKKLALNLEAPCTLDLLTAAGWVRDELGLCLFRLRGEYDAARGMAQVADGYQRQLQDQIAAKKIKSKRKNADRETIGKEIEQLEKLLERQIASDNLYIVEGLKSLGGVKEVFGAWVVAQASKFPLRDLPPPPRAPRADAPAGEHERYRKAQEAYHRRVVKAAQENNLGPDKEVLVIAGRVLQAYLIGDCHKCAGRAFIGRHGGPQLKCTACHGTGKARFSVGRTDIERAFVAHLHTEIENRVNEVRQQMRRFLDQRG